MASATSRYLRALLGGRCPARSAARALADALPPTFGVRERRRAAASAVAAAAALLPAALARHGTRRGGELSAIWDVVAKFGRLEDLDAPEIGVRAQWSRPRLDARLGGLLGSTADAIAGWLASVSGISASDQGRLVAAVAPLVLGAVARAVRAAPGVPDLLTDFPPAALERVDMLATAPDASGRVFRAVYRRAAYPRGLGWCGIVLRPRFGLKRPVRPGRSG